MSEVIDLLHVLLVDDRGADRLALQAILEQVPEYHVTVCGSGEEALKAVPKEDYTCAAAAASRATVDGDRGSPYCPHRLESGTVLFRRSRGHLLWGEP